MLPLCQAAWVEWAAWAISNSKTTSTNQFSGVAQLHQKISKGPSGPFFVGSRSFVPSHKADTRWYR